MFTIWQYITLAFLAMWTLSMLRSLCYGRLGKMVTQAGQSPTADSRIGISVIVISHDQQDELQRHLPHFLEQEYNGDFEVIVVDMASKDDTRLLLESMQPRHPNLHVTSLPATARDISLHRLAITLGMRAASYDWVIISQADCAPSSTHWLRCMAAVCQQSEGLQMVTGYTRYADGSGWNGLRRRFLRLYDQMLCLPLARNGRLYQSEGTNLAYRRSAFLAHRGFADHANLQAGATEIMVNRESKPGNTTLCLAPESIMVQDCPDALTWKEERLFHVETAQHFTHWIGYRLRHGFGVWTDRLYRISLLAALAVEILMQHWLLTALVGLLWLVHLVFRSYQWHRTTSALGEPGMHMALPLLLMLAPWWDNFTWCRWLLTGKNTFRKKFV